MRSGKGERKSKKGEAPVPKTDPLTNGLREGAAGVDIGAKEIYVAVPPVGEGPHVRKFETFTQDLYRLAEWLEQRGVKTVAMESTGVFWIPLFQILEDRGLEVCLVNAQHIKHPPRRKSDVADCQWLQQLHAAGLLSGSFRPEREVCRVRTLLRHRRNMIQIACMHIQHMRQALSQMNVQLHHVISDITGVTGLAILESIVRGDRDPKHLAQWRDPGIQATEETIIKSLEGDYRSEHVFTLRQSLESYRHHQRMIAEADREVRKELAGWESRVNPEETPMPPATKRATARGLQKRPLAAEAFNLRQEHYRILGTDLTQVPGINSNTVEVLLGELGPDLTSFRSGSAFASYLGLCPRNDITGAR